MGPKLPSALLTAAGALERLAHPLGRLFDPELAHGLAIQVLGLMPVPPRPADDPRLSVRHFGLQFPNPVGVAAGFDKMRRWPIASFSAASVSPKSARSPLSASPETAARVCFGSCPTAR